MNWFKIGTMIILGFLLILLIDIVVNGLPKGRCSPDTPEFCSYHNREIF